MACGVTQGLKANELFPLSRGFGPRFAPLAFQLTKGVNMTPSTSSDIHSEDSVFRKLFTEKKHERKMTQAERMDKLFASPAPAPIEQPIKVSDFLPQF